MSRVAVIVAALVLCGCGSPQPLTRAGIDRRGSPRIQQAGDAAAPASASVTTSVSRLTIPAGSQIAVFENPQVTGGEVDAKTACLDLTRRFVFSLSQPSEWRTDTRREAVAGAETHAPPIPPSPAEKARGFGVKVFYVAGAVLVVLAALAFYRRYFWAGVCFACAGLGAPLGANLVSEEIVIRAAGALIVAGLVFVAAWKIVAARYGLGNQAGTVAK